MYTAVPMSTIPLTFNNHNNIVDSIIYFPLLICLSINAMIVESTNTPTMSITLWNISCNIC